MQAILSNEDTLTVEEPDLEVSRDEVRGIAPDECLEFPRTAATQAFVKSITHAQRVLPNSR